MTEVVRDPNKSAPEAPDQWSMHDRIAAVLQGVKPDRVPFVTRLELWHKAHQYSGTLSPELSGLAITEVYRALGLAQQRFVGPIGIRLRGVEVIARFEGETIYRESDPLFDSFPDTAELVPPNRVGSTRTEFITPVGTLTVSHSTIPENLTTGTRCYMSEHPIKDAADYRTVEYILERADYVPRSERLRAAETEIGGAGYVVPSVPRSPFQQLLIDYLDMSSLYYALYDSPENVMRLMTLLDQRIVENLHRLAELKVPYVELGENLDGVMTPPPYFAEHVLPYYQRYAEILHAQGKKIGAHTDGNMKPLLALLTESGLDVCESISPYPLTEATFEEIWEVWQQGPIIWGAIPSPLLEETTPDKTWREYVTRLLRSVGSRPIILAVSDMVMYHNSIERIREIAKIVEEHPI